MLKASFAFGIMETIFFIWTAVLAVFLHVGEARKGPVASSYVGGRRRSHSSRRGSRGHSGSRSRARSYSRPHYVV